MIHYAYIGAGATGTSLVWQHVRQLALRVGREELARQDIRISVIEQDGVFGPGLPYGSGTLDVHILNMEASDIFIDVDDPADFTRWLEHHQGRLSGRFPDFRPSADCYAPRVALGEYLAEKFVAAEAAARHQGITIERVRKRAVSLEPLGDRVLIRYDDRTTSLADKAVLTTGHWPSTSTHACEQLGAALAAGGGGGLFFPWPAQRLQSGISPDGAVALLGTSLTALDAVLTLFDDCGRWERHAVTQEMRYLPQQRCRRVVLYSRHGFLPRVRPVPPPRSVDDNPYLTKSAIPPPGCPPEDRLDFDAVLGLFKKRLRYALWRDQRHGEDVERLWAEFVDPFGVTGEVTGESECLLARALDAARRPDERWCRIYQALRGSYSALVRAYRQFSPDDRRRFDTEFFPSFNAQAASMPVSNAEKLLALLRSGRVRVVAGFRSVHPNHRANVFELHHDLRGGASRITATRYLVNAIGKDKDITRIDAPIIRNALERGILSSHDAGGIRVDYEGSNVIDRAGQRVPNLYAIGPITIGERLGASAVAASAKFARLLVDSFLHELLSKTKAEYTPAYASGQP